MAKNMNFAPGMVKTGAINKSTDAISTLKAENVYRIKFISIDDIIPNEKNTRYPQIDIESLSASIEDRGLLHNLVVKPIDDDKYKLISGERRWRAIGLLRTNNLSRFEELFPGGLLPCKIQNSNSEIDEEIDLIIANHETRSIDIKDRLADINQLATLYKMRDDGENKSIHALSEIIAKHLDVSARQIHKYLSLDKLIPELYEAFQNGDLSITQASKLATLGETEQLYLYNILITESKITDEDFSTIKDITKKKEEADAVITKANAEIDVLESMKDTTDKVTQSIINKKIEEKRQSAEVAKEGLSKKEITRLRKITKAKKNIDNINESIEKLQKLLADVGDDAEVKVRIELLEEKLKQLL